MAGTTVCCFYAALTNCTNCVAPSSYPLLEIGSTLAGLLGFFGCLVFAAFKAGSRGTSLGSLLSGMPGMSGMSGMSGVGLGTSSRSPTAAFESSLTLDWGFYLAAVGCALTIIAAVVISLSNKPGATRGAEGPAAIPMTTIYVGQGQGLPVYQGQSQGLAPPVYQIRGQGQYYHQGQGQQFNPGQGQGYPPVQGQGQVLATGHGQGQVRGTGEPQGLGPIQFVGVPQDPS
ncbi:uncharacterized protein [Littorina saxatilis]|uniref:uncharacterized protein n=1 Tax=Littorina saxatilis TaxID=31220 RepID=UPI0038B43A39